jgi:alkylated DNA repair dioxygenase AlkB
MIYIPAAFTPVAQRTLIKGCLKEYSRHPNKSNLDTHYKVPTSGLWDLHENVYLNKQSLDDPTVFVPRKADVDNQANGYGSDDDDDDDDDDNEAEAQDSNGKKHENGARPKPSQQHQPATKKPKPSSATNPPQRRAMVPITDETPTVPDNTPKTDPEPSSQVPILPPSQLVRKMRWITLGYQYHWPSKTYHFDQNAPFPKELCILSKAVVAAVDNSGEDERDGGKFEYPYPAEDFVAEAGVINYYQLKDRLMGHVDRSELNKHAPLVSFRYRFLINIIIIIIIICENALVVHY